MSDQPLLQIDDLNVTIGQTPIIEAVNWALHAGELAAITGPNGAGKTTLLKCVLGLIPFDGTVQLSGINVDSIDRQERARRVAWVPQQSRIDVPLSVQRVVMQGRFAHQGILAGPDEEDQIAVQTAIQQVDIGHLVSRNYLSLSGGEQRRVLIARALATEAPVLLLDEPTAGLDLPHVLDLFAILNELRETGRAVVVVIHEIGWAMRFAQRVLLLCCGRRIADGTPHDVFSDKNLAKIYGVKRVDMPGVMFERVPRDE